MDWVVLTVFTSIVIVLLLSWLAWRQLKVGPSGDWLLGWMVLVVSTGVLWLPLSPITSNRIIASVGPLFSLLMLSGAYRYAERDVPRLLPIAGVVLCAVSGGFSILGQEAIVDQLALLTQPALCISAGMIAMPAARAHGTVIQRLVALGLFVMAGVEGLAALNSLMQFEMWNSMAVWLIAGLPIATLQFAGVFELVGTRLTKTSEERDQNATALAETIEKLRAAHTEMEQRITDRTAQLSEEVKERRKAEETIRARDEQHRRITSLLTDFNFAATVQPDGQLQTEWLTRGALSSLSLQSKTKTPVEWRDWQTLIHRDDLPKLKKKLEIALAEGVTNFETRIATRSEADHWVSGRMMGERDKETGVLKIHATGRDVTREKQADEENVILRERVSESQRLESLGALARGVAHDFNNLLSVILGNAAIIADALPETSPLISRADRIRKSARYAAEIAMQMLTYSGSASVSPEPLDITRLVFEMSELIEAGTQQHIRVARDLDADLPDITGDPGQIRQVILNLITNASEAMGDNGGCVELRTGMMHIGKAPIAGLRHAAQLPEGEYVYLEVADDGPGLDADTRERVFDPFFSTKLTGRGLGLAVVHGIVRAHNAAITVTSEPGAGTQFRILFPSQPVEAVASQKGTRKAELEVVDSPPLNQSATILVVDDDQLVGELAETVLRRAGFDVLNANGGREGLELFEKHADQIALVLLDLAMPDISGEEVLKKIRILSPQVPALISSGYTDSIARTRIRVTDRIDFLGKPYEPETLIDRVTSSLKDG
ncbi:MAG: signal transduction histidine kinase/CheY-like chemotaxis protein [Myxococcota bacterium]|jgi:signal transduction histidine kinase/CheY-like chemotaxis protein